MYDFFMQYSYGNVNKEFDGWVIVNRNAQIYLKSNKAKVCKE